MTRDDGTCVVVGSPSNCSIISVDPFDLIRGKQIIGSWGGGIDISPLIGIELELVDINDTVLELDSGTAGEYFCVQMHKLETVSS